MSKGRSEREDTVNKVDASPRPNRTSVADETIVRFIGNPILVATDFPSLVNVVFNPAAVLLGSATVLLVRVEDRAGLSHLHVARSENGFTDWTIDPIPVLSPVPGDHHSAWGFEDARAVWVPELDRFAITCTAYGPAGPSVHLAFTKDFVQFEHVGTVLPPEDKNASLFPRRLNGMWVMLHRPVMGAERRADIWLSRSADLVGWRAAEPVMSCRVGAWWDAQRIGLGPPPIETPQGWLMIYHGVKQSVSGAIYRVGVALLDLEDPSIVRRRCTNWLLGPEAPYERVGDVGNVVFPCGATVGADGELRIYYGAADTSVCVATSSVDALLAVLAADECAVTE